MTALRTFALAAFAAPLTLALMACGDGGDDAATGVSGDPIDPVAAPGSSQWSDAVRITEMDGYLLGNPDAPIKLVEYASLTCPACAAFAENGIEPLKQNYVDKGIVSYELRNQIHGPHDLILARLVRCGQPESYHPLSEQVWNNLNALLGPLQERGPVLEAALSQPEDQRFIAFAEAAGFIDFFAARGVSRNQAGQCLADPASLQTIAQNSETQSNELDITGTPTFLINGSKIDLGPGAAWPQVEAKLQQAGAR